MFRLMKLVAYAKAPRATFALLHPIRALKWGALLYAGKMLYDRVKAMSEMSEGTPSAR